MAFQPSTHYMNALGFLGAVDKDDELSARKKVFAAVGSKSYSRVSSTQSGLQSELSNRNSTLRLVGNILYTMDRTVFTGATESKVVADTDTKMYPYYVGSQSVKDILKFGRNELKRSGSTPANNAIRDQYVDLITDLITDLSTDTPSTTPDKVTALDPKLLSGTWNDRSYTYKIDSSGNVKVNTKTYDKTHPSYLAVVSQLNADFASDKLKKGALAASSSARVSYTPPTEVVPPPPKGITEQSWFIPVVGVTALAVVGGAAWWAFRTPQQ